MAIGVDDLATNLIASAMFEAARHPIKKYREFNARKSSIIRSVEGQSTGSKARAELATSKAFDDLIRVLGSEYGIYTQQVDRFIIELQASSFPSSAFSILIVNGDISKVRPLFQSLYDTFSPLPFSAENLFSAFIAALRNRIDSVSDPALLDVIRASSEAVRHDIHRLYEALDRAKSTVALDQLAFLDARQKVAKAIENENRDIPVETERGTRRVAITRLVIPARLSPISSEALKKNASSASNPAISLDDFKSYMKKSVVLGDPGGGKSTLTQFLCYTMSKSLSVDVVSSRAYVADADLKIPARIIVRTLERRQRQEPGYSLLDYLVDEYHTALDNNKELAFRFFSQVLVTGKALLLFDGLDEVLEVGRRREIAAQIERFTNVYPFCPSLVTSRLVGYDDAPLSEDYELHLLARLNTAEIQKFCEKLLKVIGGCKEDPKILSQRFINQTDAHAQDLRQNPLLLGLMVYIFKEKGDVPDNRPEIYKACSQLLFLKWDQRRDINYPYPEDFELLDLFGYLAVQVFGNTDMEDGVTGDWLLDKIKVFFFEWYNDRAKATAAAKSLVKFITGRAWVMTDVGPDVFKFTHRTFMEYFVARRLESESESVSEIVSVIYPKVINAEWDVVSHLALQIAASNGPKSIKAIEALLKCLRNTSRNPQEEYYLLVYTVRSLGYLALPESKFEEVLQEVIGRCFNLGIAAPVDSIPLLSNLLNIAPKKRAIAEQVIADYISQELTGESEERRRFARLCLSAHRTTFDIPRKYSRFVAAEQNASLYRTLERIRNDSRNSILESAKSNIDSARLYCLIYEEKLLELWDIHGSELLVFNTEEFSPKTYNQFSFEIIHRMFDKVERGIDLSGDLKGFMEAVADYILQGGIGKISLLLRSPEGVIVNTEAAEEAFRRLYYYSNLGTRRKINSPSSRAELARTILQSIVVLLSLVEIEHQFYPTSHSQRVRFSNKDSKKYKRSSVLDVYIPTDYFITIINKFEDNKYKTAILEWMHEQKSFVCIS